MDGKGAKMEELFALQSLQKIPGLLRLFAWISPLFCIYLPLSLARSEGAVGDFLVAVVVVRNGE